jgi:hypothetical protein
VLIFPAERRLAISTEDIRDGVETCQQDTFFCRAASNVDHSVEEIGFALAALKRLGDQLIVIGEMCSAMNAAVPPMTVLQVRAVRLHACLSTTLFATPQQRQH